MNIVKTLLCLFLIVTICACTTTSNIKNISESVAQEMDIVEEEKGVVFLDLTFEQALEKAKNEGKSVFMNFHTQTCGACRKMEKTVFTSPVCGRYINRHFVPIMIDGEDGGAGTEIAKKYTIFIFPTYLILNSDGSKVGEISGAEFNLENFVNKVKGVMK